MSSPVLERIPLTSVLRVKEALDGFEELEGLPHSFAIDLHEGESYTFLADAANQKVLFLFQP